MILISSKAGQRLAKTKVAVRKAEKNYRNSNGCPVAFKELDYARLDYSVACTDLANELIASRHHEAEGD